MEKMRGLDLFSGIGGISLGLSRWVEPIAYCEILPFAQKVLLSRMLTGDLPTAPIWDDVRSLQGQELPRIDIIYGGFPCQDISLAGKGRGLEGERSGLFFEIKRLIDECKPTFVFLENVSSIRTRGLGTVLQELTNSGYDCRWCVLPASHVGAPHERRRWFCLAKKMVDANSQGEPGLPRRAQEELYGSGNPDQPSRWDGWWENEPNVGRMVDGIRTGVDDRLSSLGNAVVPAQVEAAFSALFNLLP